MTTNIDDLINDCNSILTVDYDNLQDSILDLSQNIDSRIKALEKYYSDKKEETIEIISRLNGMYQMSGIKIIEEFLTKISYNNNLSILLRLEASKALEYRELEDDIEDCDTEEERKEKEKENELVRLRNINRSENNSNVLNEICSKSSELPTPCRVESILSLMKFSKYELEVNNYFISLINDQNIDCEFRYTTILSLEHKSIEYQRKSMENYFKNKDFVQELFSEYSELISKEFPKYVPDIENYSFFKLLLSRMDYDFSKKMMKKFTNNICIYEMFLFNAQLAFLKKQENMTYYKVLSAQYILQNFDKERNEVEKILLSFALDDELDYDRRADAADVLLQLGSTEMKENGRDIIMQLGENNGQVRTVFDNAQNVHIEEVEQSVSEVLEFFSTMPLLKINEQAIEFDYVKTQVEKLLKEQKNENENDEEIKKREKKIQIALSRINLDRALYSKYNSSLSNILIKVWTYIHENENEEEMNKRLLEELEEMSGTCSTGFASRLINVISGFGEFNIRISWEDQVTANFAGRLNAVARKITNEDSIFHTYKIEDVVKLWFNDIEQQKLKEDIIKNLHTSKYITENPTLSDVVTKYLEEDKEQKVKDCIEDFSEKVINEMALPSSSTNKRLHFSLFFRTYVAYIREEMYEEFKEHLDDTSFDLYMRKAMMHYEGQ